MTLDFSKTCDQKYFCYFRNKDRTMRYAGRCACCGKRVFFFLDGENDPRGPLGDHAASSLVASDYNAQGPDVIACFGCTNDYNKYQRLMQIAQVKWKFT